MLDSDSVKAQSSSSLSVLTVRFFVILQRKVPFPMISVCPQRASWLRIIEYLFNAEKPNEAEKAFLSRWHLEEYFHHLRTIRRDQGHKVITWEKPWTPHVEICETTPAGNSTACDLLTLLYRWVTSTTSTKRQDRLVTEESVFDFVISRVLNNTPTITLEELEAFYAGIRPLPDVTFKGK